MKYVFLVLLLLVTSCKKKDTYGCTEAAKILSQNVKEMNNLAFSHQPVKFKLMIDVEFGAYELERCVKQYYSE
jgi:hypothetical protein